MPNAITVGNEILVNTATAGAQDDPAIAALAGGRFVVTWTDWSQSGADTSQAAVRAQIFNADGSKAGNEFMVNTTTLGTQDDPVVATLADGRFIIGWEDASRGAGDNSGSAIRAQIFNADGTQSGGEFIIPTTTFSHQSVPTIAGLPDGRFVAAWMDSSGIGDLQPTGIRAQIFNADGTRSGGEILVNTTTQNGQEDPSIAVLADGRFAVTWTDQSTTGGDVSNAAIRAQVFNGDGTKSGGELLVNTTTPGVQFDPSITGLTDDRFVVAWTDFSQTGGDASGPAVRAQIFNGDGSRSGGEFLVNTTTAGNQQQSSIAALPDGGFVAVWGDGSGSTATGFQVRAQVFGSDGSKLGAEFVANTTVDGAQWRPAVTALDAGRFAVAWEDQSATGGDTSSHAIRAQIFDLREAPIITSDGGGATATVSVSENTNGVTTVTATDADSPMLSYSIAGGADAAQFQIDSSTGALSFVTAPNFEMPADADSDNSYEVVVSASDGALSDTQAITVTIANVNEAPVISPDRTVARAENTQAAMYVDTYDPENDGVAFSIVGGADASLFQIDSATGALSFVTAPDFEAPGDADHNNSYLVVARVSDGTLSADQAIRVEISDANEAPAITSGGSVAISENTTAVTAVTGSDPDTGTTLHYSIAGGADAALFQIDDATGALSFKTAPDFEAPADADHDNSYQVVVRASDGSLPDYQAITVNVADVSEQSAPGPRFGGEFLVNTTTFGHQLAPAIAGAASGRFVAAWADGSRSGDDPAFDAIRVQVFNADGSKAGAELLANATTAGSQDEPAVATLSDGRFVVAWTDYYEAGTNGSASSIRAQVFNLDGTKLGAEFLVNATDAGRQTHAVISGLADGRFVVAWEGGSAADHEGIRAQVFNADGTKSGAEFQANATTAGYQADAAIAVLPDGRFVLSWTDQSASGGDQSLLAVRAQIFHPDGTPAGNEFLVNTTTFDTQATPTIAGLPDGRLVAAWTDVSQTGSDTDHGAVRAQIFNGDGTKAGSEFLVNTTAVSDQYAPTITALRDGHFVVAWTDTSATGADTSDQAVRAQVFDRDGTKVGDELVVNATTPSFQFDPTIAPLADGRFTVAWADASQAPGDESGLAIRAQIFDTRTAAVHIKGTAGDDDYIGTGFDDTMRGGPGNDRLDGGGGDDTAIFAQSRDQYSVQATEGGKFTVSGPDGVDTLSNFEHLRFADVTLDAGNLHAPQITSDGGGDSATLAVSEHGTAVTTVSATDADPGTTLRYAVTGGADASAFVIDPATGALAFAAAPDFANPTDADHDNSYVVQVRASDGVLTDTQTITVNVADVSEAPGFVWLKGTRGDDTFTALPGNERIDARGGNDTVIFDFKLTDAQVTYAGNKVIIDSATSHTVLTGFERYVFADGTVDNNDGNPLVDDLFYYSQNHDVWNAGADADRHYHEFGWHEGRDPSAFFSTATYLSLYPDVKAVGADPLEHFHQAGWKEGRAPSFAFDDAAYLAANPDVAADHADPLAHFLEWGAQEDRQPFALDHLFAPNGFDYVYYLQHNPDVAAAHADPLQHFETFGWREGRNPNAWFDTNGYLAHYADVATSNLNPLTHYAQFGWHEGRDPSTAFDTLGYLAANPDVMASHADPLLHFLQFGVHEGRTAFADGAWG